LEIIEEDTIIIKMDVEGAECQYNLGEMGGAHAMA